MCVLLSAHAGCGSRSLLDVGSRGIEADAATVPMDAGPIPTTAVSACRAMRDQACRSFSLGSEQLLEPPAASGLARRPFGLRSAIGTCDGAFLLTESQDASSSRGVTGLWRLDTAGAVTRAGAWYPPRKAVGIAARFEGDPGVTVWQTDTGAFAYQPGITEVTEPEVTLALLHTWSLGGVFSVARTPTGFSFLAEQIRALWGATMITVTQPGDRVAGVDLGLDPDIGLSGGGMANISRLTYDDGSFTLLSSQAGQEPPSRAFARYVPTDGTKHPSTEIVPDARLDHAVRVGDGFAVPYLSNSGRPSIGFAFYTSDGTALPRTARHVLEMAEDAVPLATVAKGDMVLFAVRGGSGVPLVTVYAAGPRDSTFVRVGILGRGYHPRRLVMVPSGKNVQVIWEDEAESGHGVTLACEP